MAPSHEREKRPTVPKFASFKPKAAGIADTDTPSAVAIEEASAVVKSESRSRADSHRQAPQRKPEHNDVYYLDKKGDPLITQYGGNDRRQIPQYRRFGAGRVLGVDGFMRIERFGNREEFSLSRNHREGGSLLSSDKKSLKTRGIRLDEKPIRIRPKQCEATVATEEFISLGASKKRKRSDSPAAESSDDEGPLYRSIHGKSRKHEHSDDEQYDSDQLGGALNESIDDPLRVRSIELSKKVQENPKDVESWLELINHQDALLHSQNGSRAPTAAEIKSFADIKLALLEKAMKHVDDHQLRELLDMKLMTLGVKVWEPATTQKEFAKMMRNYPRNFQLWKQHISFLQSTLTTCRYDEVKRIYTNKLQSLGGQLSALSSFPEKFECAEQVIDVFLHLTRFLVDAGFPELASAAWQASLELNFARPPTSLENGWEVPSSFQEFWESEIPRLGEDDWRGWTAFVADSTAQEPPNPRVPDPPVMPTTRDGYKAWHTVEHHMGQNAMTPARTLDEGAEDDPYRVVMFTDFQDILLYFPVELLPRIQPLLLDAFLIFCQLPPGSQCISSIQAAVKDPFLARSPQGVPFAHIPPSSNTPEESEQHQTRSPDFFNELQQVSLTPDILFPSKQWFRYLERISDRVPSDHCRWVITTLKQLTGVVQIKQLNPYSLAFESINEPGNERKAAKILMKRDPLNVDLYLGYSILMSERDKDTARLILSSAQALEAISDHDRLRLRIAAAWLELLESEFAKAVSQLCRIVEDASKSVNEPVSGDSEATPSLILKARQHLVTSRDYKISSGEIDLAVLYAEALVLLEYLTQKSEKEPNTQNQGDICSAIVSITQCSDDLDSHDKQKDPAHERFLQSAARLLYYHASHGSFRPGLLREQLTRYLSYFPSNTIFLALFAWRQERLTINDRVRSLLQDHVLTRANETLTSHAFAISYELRTGNAHSTRAAFERALSSDVCAHNVGLWVAYVRFCHSRRELRAKAKAVFYRALQACPWSKEVFMEAYGTLIREMDTAELESVYTTMCEKGLRVHVEMDEFVRKWRREQKEKQKGGKTRQR